MASIARCWGWSRIDCKEAGRDRRVHGLWWSSGWTRMMQLKGHWAGHPCGDEEEHGRICPTDLQCGYTQHFIKHFHRASLNKLGRRYHFPSSVPCSSASLVEKQANKQTTVSRLRRLPLPPLSDRRYHAHDNQRSYAAIHIRSWQVVDYIHSCPHPPVIRPSTSRWDASKVSRSLDDQA
ncbi:hypothetical protein LY76DRAFT_174462 [Colletotrichum caudatum]|nr:hypothetical protein LY76DRAFT_174462 [Colletotrichum caudatum]